MDNEHTSLANNPFANKEKLCALVAGGAGFVGSHLCRSLLQAGYACVVCLDNLQTGNMKNIADLQKDKRFTFIRHDIIHPINLDLRMDEIYHLACPASPKQYQQDPVHTFKTSVIGSINLLDMAKEKGSRILLASTSEVYGNPSVPQQNESYWGNVNPYGIRSCYDEGKRGAETLFHDYNAMYGVDSRIIRIFNTYGPSMSTEDGRVVSNFIVQALKGNPITIHGNGSQTRSFQYVDDLIEAIFRVMRDGVPNSPINIGNPNEISVKNLADMVLRMTNSKSVVTYEPLPQDDPCKRKPDISLATRVLNGWEPQICLTEELTRTIDYFRNILNK